MRHVPILAAVLLLVFVGGRVGESHAQTPAWAAPGAVDPSAYDTQMTALVAVYIDGALADQPGAYVGAFVGGTVRGATQPVAVGDDRVAFLTIFADASESGEPVSLRYYDPVAETERDLNDPFGFGSGETLGTLAAPRRAWVYVATPEPFGDPTRWTPPAGIPAQTMTVVAGIWAGGERVPLGFVAPPGSMPFRLVAFVGDEPHGLVEAAEVAGEALFFLSIGGSLAEDGARLRLRVFDPASGDVYAPEPADAATFAPGAVRGSAPAPVQLSIAETPLPVELATFEAIADGNDAVHLAWTTLGETGNAGFYVEHQHDLDASWKPLGFVTGAGTTAEAQRYGFRAEHLGAGTHRFRLRQVDFDGGVSYGPEIEIALDAGSTFALGPLYPNPATTQTRATLTLPPTSYARVAVYDPLGRRLVTLFDGAHEGGTLALSVDAATLPSGVYLVRAEAHGQALTQRLVVLR